MGIGAGIEVEGEIGCKLHKKVGELVWLCSKPLEEEVVGEEVATAAEVEVVGVGGGGSMVEEDSGKIGRWVVLDG